MRPDSERTVRLSRLAPGQRAKALRTETRATSDIRSRQVLMADLGNREHRGELAGLGETVCYRELQQVAA